MNAIGIDIGTYSFKAVQAKVKGDQTEIIKTVEGPNRFGISVPNDDVTKEKLAQAIEAFFSDNTLPTSDVRLALPESLVSTKVIGIPMLTDAELASAIGWQAEQHIPIPKDDLSLEYEVIFRPPAGDKETPMRVLLVGSRKSIIERYVDVFSMFGIEPTFLETQTLSVLRALHVVAEDPPTMVVHIGFSTMDISIIRGGELVFVVSHPLGGVLLNRSLENTLQLSVAQSEEYKRTYGLDPQFFEGKVQSALMPVLNSYMSEMKKALHFFTMQYPQEKVERVLLSGGSAQLPGLVGFTASSLGVEALLANPFSTATGAVPQSGQTSFTVCMGLIARNE